MKPENKQIMDTITGLVDSDNNEDFELGVRLAIKSNLIGKLLESTRFYTSPEKGIRKYWKLRDGHVNPAIPFKLIDEKWVIWCDGGRYIVKIKQLTKFKVYLARNNSILI